MIEPLTFEGVYLAGKPTGTLWNISCNRGQISSISECHAVPDADRSRLLLTPGLCHPHIHLDKCFLLSHPKYSDLEIERGDFAEAMELTNKAKSRFELEDLLERGRALIEESIGFGVTHMRAFVEVDRTVGMKCLEAGLLLKAEFRDHCHIQICAFAQDPIYSQNDGGFEMLKLLEEAAVKEGVDVLGSTPYVEKNLKDRYANIQAMVELAMKHSLHLDFHLDYSLDPNNVPSVYQVIHGLEKANWKKSKAVTLGHCTRLTLFNRDEWEVLREQIGELPISFVGLPTSDMFIMGRIDEEAGGGERFRGTLQVPQMLKKYGLQAALGVNNVGNAFTPQGSCDPLSVASLGVGIYQAGTKADADILLECVSTRARAAIGLGSRTQLALREGDAADLVAFGTADGSAVRRFRCRRSTAELVYDACRERTTFFGGRVVS